MNLLFLSISSSMGIRTTKITLPWHMDHFPENQAAVLLWQVVTYNLKIFSFILKCDAWTLYVLPSCKLDTSKSHLSWFTFIS